MDSKSAMPQTRIWEFFPKSVNEDPDTLSTAAERFISLFSTARSETSGARLHFLGIFFLGIAFGGIIVKKVFPSTRNEKLILSSDIVSGSH
jgi:hypothetical protein